MTLRMPDILRMSSCPPIACMTEPADRNSRALKNACVKTWNTADRFVIGRRGHAQAKEHVTELGQGRIGPDALEVILAQGDGCGQHAVAPPMQRHDVNGRRLLGIH